MTSRRLTFQDLPDDILVEIFNVSDEATLMACDSVSDRFHHVIQSVPQLAYRYALKTAGMKENAVPDEATASQRHVILKNSICTWLEPTVVDISPLLPTGAGGWQRDNDIDNIFGDILWQKLQDGQHLFIKILSPQSWGRKLTWVIHNAQDKIAVDGAQNLLVSFPDDAIWGHQSPSARSGMRMSLQRIQDGQVHPEASVTALVCNHEHLKFTGPVRIHGSHLIAFQRRAGLIVWNWRSGDKLMDIRCAGDAIFLTEDLLLVAKQVRDTSNPQRVSSSIIILHPRLVVFSIACRRAILELECPSVHCPGKGSKATSVFKFFRDTTPSYHEEIPSAFRMTAEDRVIAISLGVIVVPESSLRSQPSSEAARSILLEDLISLGSEDAQNKGPEAPYGVRCAIYIPMSTIWRQIHLAETQLPHQHIVPWSDWGPEGTHMVFSSDTPGLLRVPEFFYCTTVSTYGTRALEVLPPCNEAGLQYLRVYDFSKHARDSNNVPSEPSAAHGNDPVPSSYSHDELAAKIFVEPQDAKTRYPVQTRLVPLPLLPEGAEYTWDTVSMINEHMLFGRSIPFETSFYAGNNWLFHSAIARFNMKKRFAVMSI